MKVLVLGGAGMLGHKLVQVLPARFETFATVRELTPSLQQANRNGATLVSGVSADAFDSIVAVVQRIRPTAVVNCIGIIKQKPEAKDPITSIRINSLLPHELAQLCEGIGARLVHISTDCVFSGTRGNYNERDIADPIDLYGHSKLLGEVVDHGAITLRTSIIGRELGTRNGLLEWFLANRGGNVDGYPRAVFSGLPTFVLAELIAEILDKHTSLSGLVHVSADPINKLDLLKLFDEAFETRTKIARNEDVVIDRSLDSSRFRAQTGFTPLPWSALVARMASDAKVGDL